MKVSVDLVRTEGTDPIDASYKLLFTVSVDHKEHSIKLYTVKRVKEISSPSHRFIVFPTLNFKLTGPTLTRGL